MACNPNGTRTCIGETNSQYAASSINVAVMSAEDPAEDPESWMQSLSPADQAACARDIAAAADPRQELISWRETATAIAAGLDQTANLEWLGSDEVVERP